MAARHKQARAAPQQHIPDASSQAQQAPAPCPGKHALASPQQQSRVASSQAQQAPAPGPAEKHAQASHEMDPARSSQTDQAPARCAVSVQTVQQGARSACKAQLTPPITDGSPDAAVQRWQSPSCRALPVQEASCAGDQVEDTRCQHEVQEQHAHVLQASERPCNADRQSHVIPGQRRFTRGCFRQGKADIGASPCREQQLSDAAAEPHVHGSNDDASKGHDYTLAANKSAPASASVEPWAGKFDGRLQRLPLRERMRALTQGSQKPDGCEHGSDMNASKGETDAGAADSAPPAPTVGLWTGKADGRPQRLRMRVPTQGSQKHDSHEFSHMKQDKVCLSPAYSNACQLQ